MSRGRAEIPPAPEPFPSSPSARAAASTAERTGPWTDRGTAAGAYAIAPSDERGSLAGRLPLPIRERVRMAAALDAPHRPVYLPPSVLPRLVGIGNFFVCLFRAAIGAPDGPGRPPFVV